MLYGRIQTTFIQDISASAPGDLGLLAISNSNDGRTADDNQEQEVLNNYQFPAAQLTFLRPLRRPISDSSHQLGTRLASPSHGTHGIDIGAALRGAQVPMLLRIHGRP